MRFTVAHLNRPTRDGRVLTSIEIGDGPWNVLAPGRGPIGAVTAVEVVDGRVEVELTTDEPVDWTVHRPHLDLRNVELHSIGSEMRLSGEFGAVTVLAPEGFGWPEEDS